MRRGVIVAGTGIVLVVAQACLLVPANEADGAPCSDNSACASGRCFEGYCSGANCEKDKSACLAGWKCVHSDPDPISDFFGSDGTDVCRPTCGSCPGNQHCAKGGKIGETLCSLGPPPLDIAITPSEAVAGHPVKLTASAVDGTTLTSCTWEISGGQAAEQSRAAEITHTFKDARPTRVAARCEGDGRKSGSGEVSVAVSCQPSGSACMPSFCCEEAGTACLPGAAGNVCRVPVDATVAIAGPTAVALDEDAEYTATITSGDGPIQSVYWKFSDTFVTSSGITIKHSFSRAGKGYLQATVKVHGKSTETKLDVMVCQRVNGSCSDVVPCCAPMACNAQTKRCL